MNNPTLPPGITKEAFERAIGEYRQVLGTDNVIVDADKLAPYDKIMIPEDIALHRPSGALLVQSTEEVQKVVAIANRYKTPLWPISTGRNFGYGSAAPATPGQLVLDLRGMNRIIEVDETLCTALVEPGVTYRQLIDYINERNLNLWVSFPASSVLAGPIGNTLDRGVGYNRNAEHFANFCGLEIVLANGELLRTGLGGVGDGRAWQNYRWGYGPWVDGLFSQSNLGIVTKMGLWLMKKPAAHLFFMVTWEDEKPFVAGCETAAQLKLDAILDSVVAGDTWYGVAQRVRRADIYSGKDAIPDEVLAKFRADNFVPHYALVSTLYGTQEQVSVAFDIVRSAFEKTGGKVLSGKQVEGNPDAEHAERLATGVPDMDEFGVYNYRGGGGSAWFAPVVPLRAEDMLLSMKLGREIFRKHGFEYAGGFVLNSRSAEHIIDLLFDRDDPEETARAYACFKEATIEHAKLGYGLYRTNTAFMALAAESYGPAQLAFNKSLKIALDPNGILAPGKSGIHA